MSGILWNLIAFLLALAILISVHEFGHFWVARRVGVRVERFSIGFGKALFRRVDKHGCEFVLAMIPLGGYVKMLDERVAPVEPELRQYAFNNKTILQRAAVIAAGPVANFVLAVLAYWLVFMHGVPGVKPVIGEIAPHSIAAQAQIMPGMELKAINGIETPDWDAVRMALIGKIGDASVQLSVAPVVKENASDKQKPTAWQNVVQKTLDLRHWQFDPQTEDPVTSLGIQPYGSRAELVLSQVLPDLPASKAGLLAGDKLVKVNDKPLQNWQEFVRLVSDNPDKAMSVEVIRERTPLSLTLIPDKKTVGGKVQGFVGVVPTIQSIPKEYIVLRQYGPISAIGEAGGQTWQLMKLTTVMLGKLIVGDIKLSNLSGPISIAQGAGMSASYGWVYYLIFLALISVNLGIINLFPLPVLDGGHLMFLLLEKLKGTPVSERFQEVSYRIGSVVLVLLMGLAIFNDFSRL